MKTISMCVEPGVLKDFEFVDGKPQNLIGEFVEATFNDGYSCIIMVLDYNYKPKNNQLDLFPYLCSKQSLKMLVSDSTEYEYTTWTIIDVKTIDRSIVR